MKFGIEIIKPSKVSVDQKTFMCKINIINRLDQETSAEFDFISNTLIRGGLTRLLIDLDELRYIDSSGIGKMINLTKSIRAMKGNIAIARCTASVQEIFKLVQLEKFIKIFNSNDEAINYLKLS
jgi:anti-sigma B factor antagonist